LVKEKCGLNAAFKMSIWSSITASLTLPRPEEEVITWKNTSITTAPVALAAPRSPEEEDDEEEEEEARWASTPLRASSRSSASWAVTSCTPHALRAPPRPRPELAVAVAVAAVAVVAVARSRHAWRHRQRQRGRKKGRLRREEE
jgi:hypothetical protein